jgi:signal transduction histidine kinase
VHRCGAAAASRCQLPGIIQGEATRLDFSHPDQDRYYELRATPQPTGRLVTLLDVTSRRREYTAQLQALGARVNAAVEAERNNLARELHDRVGQSLTAVDLKLTLLGLRLEGELRVQADQALALNGATSAMVRSLLAELRPPVLDELGLFAAVRWQGERFEALWGIPVCCSERGLLRVRAPSSESAVAIVRIVQEALHNVAKHAGATLVQIDFEATSTHELRIVLSDNGRGFEPTAGGGVACFFAADPNLHLGLLGMSERAHALGGSLNVESAPGRGTRVVLKVPV